MAGETELRYVVAPITRVEVRDPTGNDDNTWTMSGYAAVFNQTTTLYNGRFMQIDEQIDPGAFRNVLSNQRMDQPGGVVHFNFGHDMNRAVAATDVTAGQPGSLQLTTDSQGLYFLAKVPRDDPDGVALAAKMRSGVVKQASFAFTIDQLDTDEAVDEETGRTLYSDTIMQVRHLYDVCACAQGAYSQTVSGLRSYAAMLGQPAQPTVIRVTDELVGGPQRQPALGGASPVSPVEGGSVDITPPRWSVPPALAERAAAVLTGRNRDVRTGHQSDEPHV